MSEVKTLQEIRANLKKEVEEIVMSLQQTDIPVQQQLAVAVGRSVGHIIERALHDFDLGVEDKARYLKLGEAADKFIQAMKLPPVEIKK